jgi:DNA-binding MarR family transcriptional regulator
LSRTKTRAALLQELQNAMRIGSSQGAVFAKIIADRAGISSADMDCIDFVNVEGRMTAGRLAELTGLTTGAITGVVDRLEKAGLVRRERDESDRRKVFIAPVPENLAKIGRLYEPMQQAMLKLWSSYSDAELRLLVRFAEDGYKTMLEATEGLKAAIETPAEKRAVRKPPPRR